jgi:hypothetical protein
MAGIILVLLTSPTRALAYRCEGLGCVHQPDSTFEGKSHGEWSAAYWQWLFSLPHDQNPERDGNQCLHGANGQSGPVWFLAQSGGSGVIRHCTVPAYKAVFVPVVAGECSTLEGPPFHGENEAQLRACIKAIADQATALTFEFDGQAVTNLNEYRVQSPLFEFTVPDNNLLGVPAGTGLSVSDGYYVLLRRIEPGQHTIHAHAEVPAFGFVQDITYHLTAEVVEPVILTQPTNQAVYVGETANFNVEAAADGPFFQWRFNGVDLGDSQIASSLVLQNVQFTNAGGYSVVISDFNGAVTSRVAWLSVLPVNVVNLGDRELRFGQLSAPIWTAAHINDEGQSLTGDGLTLFYGSKAPGGSGDLDIWMVTRPTLESTNWSTPVNLGPTVNSPDIDTVPRLSPDGLSLYFASTRPGGQGGYDTWVTTRSSRNGPFGPPVNLGPAVNSSADDGAVDISADNRTLVFNAVNRPGGRGQDDVWMSTRADANAPWGPAQNLGAPINSSSGDFPVALSRDGLVLFFKSWRPILEGNRAAAIYVCRRASADQPFGAPVLVRPILSIGPGGSDFSSLSDDGTTLYVGTYRDKYPEWPQLVQISIAPLPQLSAPRKSLLGNWFPVIQFELLGREGATYEIETSTDCRSWTPWLTTNTASSVRLSDPAENPEGRRFYRALSH